ncbi:S8 family serine peptidase [Actinokineospora xionganensis]|uniref:S8 family serine peptidase n=1 Tax=Actinokineospora xionganensis TaxID=2684470 RepID=A0ABR7LA42_9PSEU|nr:S8 family serine peptidase [Actinokineospora xionganensis]MBC6449590.1 S8 family serine peptidase [Actinokineospora xionganensis]
MKHSRRRLSAVLGLTAALVVAPTATTSMAATGATDSTYVVLYRQGASTADAGQAIAAAGGTVVANYAEIGVIVARSANSGFANTVKKSSEVDGVSATSGLGTRVAPAAEGGSAEAEAVQATWGDTLSGRQWDMVQINVPQAHAVTGGSDSVVVGNLDTGLDFTHPDIAPNYDATRSADCSSGAATPLAVGNDAHGHGTHTGGTIAAAANGSGIVGVAPNVKLAGIKSSNDDGYFFPEMVVCSFMWAAKAGINVTNNSYYADPWLFNCKNDAEQRAIWEAERRAIRYAQSKGVLVIASQGNDRSDRTHPAFDDSSPDYPPGNEEERRITNACSVVPLEVPGVVGVTATGNLRLKSFYSSYGISTAEVTAPGGDSILQRTDAAPNGLVLSTWPATASCNPVRTVFDPGTGAKYCYAQGTSMAGPHAVGVAALLMSVQSGTPGQVAARLQQATNPLSCPDTSIYAPFPQLGGAPQTCQGGPAHNSFYGAGEVDALKAVS